MLTSKFLTSALTALTVVGTAGLVYAQSTTGAPSPSSEPQVQAQPSVTPPGSGGMTAPASGMTTPAMNQDATTMDQPVARADRN
jgi:hypothetical protein